MKKILISIFILTMIFTTTTYATSKEVYYADTVPEEMLPETEITFVDSTHYVIDKGGKIQKKAKLLLPSDIQKKIKTSKNDGTYDTAFQDVTIKPVKGLKILYADDGFILQTIYPKGVENPLLVGEEISTSVENPLLREGPGPNDTLLFRWGAHNNQIWRINGSKTARFGYGRATTFSDKYGQMDNVLKKGDAATSLKYDNCTYGKELVVVRRTKNSPVPYTHSLYKKDLGGMPDAVLDIWKTGVEYWGYTWTSTLSLNDTQYVHN